MSTKTLGHRMIAHIVANGPSTTADLVRACESKPDHVSSRLQWLCVPKHGLEHIAKAMGANGKNVWSVTAKGESWLAAQSVGAPAAPKPAMHVPVRQAFADMSAFFDDCMNH